MNEDERATYEALLDKLKVSMPGMNAVQELLVERIAYNYTVMRSKEERE